MTDADEGVLGRQGVVFSLYSRDGTPIPFRVDPDTGHLFVYLLNDTDQLDREVTPVYTLTVRNVVPASSLKGTSGEAAWRVLPIARE